MNPQPKQQPVRLKGKKLADLKKSVIERDVYCWVCSSPYNLSVHHVLYLSRGGSDKLSNMITLCACCHCDAHQEVLKIYGEYPEFKFDGIKKGR